MNPERKRNQHFEEWWRKREIQSPEKQFSERWEAARRGGVWKGRDQSLQGGWCDQSGGFEQLCVHTQGGGEAAPLGP